jgi:excisionase family DNA binding protein
MAALDLLSVRDMASELHVSRSTVYDWIAKGRIPKLHRLPNGEIRIARADFIEWFQQLRMADKGARS